MANLLIEGTAVFGVKKLTKHEYTSENDGYKGKSYFRYRANNRVFVVHEDDDFNAAFDAKDLAEVHLIETPSKEDASIMQLTLDYCVTQEQMIKHASFEAKLEAIKSGAMSVKLDLNEVEDLS
jgi:hypothetical protein